MSNGSTTSFRRRKSRLPDVKYRGAKKSELPIEKALLLDLKNTFQRYTYYK